MSTFTRRTEIPVPAEAVFAWHENPGAFQRLLPPWQQVHLGDFEGIRDGDRAEIRLGPGPFTLKWIAEHRDYEQGRSFTDVQIRGPFAQWEHRHRVLPHDLDRRLSVLEDSVEYKLPFNRLTQALVGHRAEREMVRMFAYRHRITREDLIRHDEAGLPALNIAITGASGLLGRALAAFFLTGGHNVVRLVRSAEALRENTRLPRERAVYWDPASGALDAHALDGVDAVIHLAGEPLLAGPWTRERRTRIMLSRARGTRLLADVIAAMPQRPAVLISASGTGYYGDRANERLTEGSPAGEGFLPEVCRAWEAATEPAAAAGVRVCTMRLGTVLSPHGGALQLMHPLFLLGLGGRIGRGREWVPWIALDDVLYAVLHLLTHDEVRGPVNFTAPRATTQRGLASSLAQVLARPAPMRIPTPLARLVAARELDETLLASARVIPDALANSGFRFAYPRIESALAHLLGRATAVSLPESS
jgi:uncharacterized protein